MSMAEHGDIGPVEKWANGKMYDLGDSKEYGFCSVPGVAILVFLSVFVWFIVSNL